MRRALLTLACVLALGGPVAAQRPAPVSDARIATLKAQYNALARQIDGYSKALERDEETPMPPALTAAIEGAFATEPDVRAAAVNLLEADGAVSFSDITTTSAAGQIVSEYRDLLDDIIELEDDRGVARRGAVDAALRRRLAFVLATPRMASPDQPGRVYCTGAYKIDLSNLPDTYPRLFADAGMRAAALPLLEQLQAKTAQCQLTGKGDPDEDWIASTLLLARAYLQDKQFAKADDEATRAYDAAHKQAGHVGVSEEDFTELWRPVLFGQIFAAEGAGRTGKASALAAELAAAMAEGVDADPDADPFKRLTYVSGSISLDPHIAAGLLPPEDAARALDRIESAYVTRIGGDVQRVIAFEMGAVKAFQHDAPQLVTQLKPGVAARARLGLAKAWAPYGPALISLDADLVFNGDVAAARAHYALLLSRAPGTDAGQVELLFADRLYAYGLNDEARAAFIRGASKADALTRLDGPIVYADFLWAIEDWPGIQALADAWFKENKPTGSDVAWAGIMRWRQAQAYLAAGDYAAAEAAARAGAALFIQGKTTTTAPAARIDVAAFRVTQRLIAEMGMVQKFDAEHETPERRCARAAWEIDSVGAIAQAHETDRVEAVLKRVATLCPSPSRQYAERLRHSRIVTFIYMGDEARARTAIGPLDALTMDDVSLYQVAADMSAMPALGRDLRAQTARWISAQGQELEDQLDAATDRCTLGIDLSVLAELDALQKKPGARERAAESAAMCKPFNFVAGYFNGTEAIVAMELGDEPAARKLLGSPDSYYMRELVRLRRAAERGGLTALVKDLSDAQAREVERLRKL